MVVSCGRFGKQKVVLIVVIHPDGFGWCKGVEINHSATHSACPQGN